MATNAELRAAAELMLALKQADVSGELADATRERLFPGMSDDVAMATLEKRIVEMCSHILATVRDDERAAFEAWISASPFEMDVTRWPQDETKFAWPGSYKSITVDLAWCAWQASKEITVPSFATK